MRVLSSGVAGESGVTVYRVQYDEEGEVVQFVVDDEVKWSFGSSQGISWEFYMA